MRDAKEAAKEVLREDQTRWIHKLLQTTYAAGAVAAAATKANLVEDATTGAERRMRQ